MKITFSQIKKQLEDPFFELQNLGKDAIRQRMLPVDKYGSPPANLRFIEWVPEDNNCVIQYSVQHTEIGILLLASTSKGLCFLGFTGKNTAGINTDFIQRFPKQPMEENGSEFQQLAIEYCNGNRELPLPLHVKGTRFQIEIWKQLIRIPMGKLSTYGSLAPNAGGAQAIGSAVGANPISYIVPCHRVVKNDGRFDGYHWGTEIKKQLLAYEFQCCQ